jgi:hypothetical protein
MDKERLLILWNQIGSGLHSRGLFFDDPEPRLNIDVPGNKADTTVYILAARYVDAIAYFAQKKGKTCTPLQLHEDVAHILPTVIIEAKKLKHH